MPGKINESAGICTLLCFARGLLASGFQVTGVFRFQFCAATLRFASFIWFTGYTISHVCMGWSQTLNSELACGKKNDVFINSRYAVAVLTVTWILLPNQLLIIYNHSMFLE